MRPSVMARKTVPGRSADLVVQYILQESCRHGLSVYPCFNVASTGGQCLWYEGGAFTPHYA